jgi:hypothetical protein
MPIVAIENIKASLITTWNAAWSTAIFYLGLSSRNSLFVPTGTQVRR